MNQIIILFIAHNVVGVLRLTSSNRSLRAAMGETCQTSLLVDGFFVEDPDTHIQCEWSHVLELFTVCVSTETNFEDKRMQQQTFDGKRLAGLDAKPECELSVLWLLMQVVIIAASSR